MLASQSRALKTRITAWFPKKIEPKNGLLDWRPGPGTIDQKLENMPPVWLPPENRKPKTKFFFLIWARRRAESAEGLNSSLAQSAGEL